MKASELIQNKVPSIGSLLSGVSKISSNGIENWFDFPRYRVVAIHMNQEVMFLEILNSLEEVLSYEYMGVSSNQWKPYVDQFKEEEHF